jgi:hypothetical protein
VSVEKGKVSPELAIMAYFPDARLWFAKSFKAAYRFNANFRTPIGVAFLIENRRLTNIQIAEVALVQHVTWEGKRTGVSA